MKYISLLILAIAILTACGKKTEPISKDSLDNLSTPSNVVLKAVPEGFFIANNEDAILYVEKSLRKDDSCGDYSSLKKLPPKGDFIDKDVVAGQQYSYKMYKQTLKYKLVSEPRYYPVTYTVPPVVLSAETSLQDGRLSVTITPSAEYIRLDVITGKKSILQTAERSFTIDRKKIVNNTINITLMDVFNNSGEAYTISTKQPDRLKPLSAPEALTAAFLGGALRIVWDSVDSAQSYKTEVCDSVSCETIKTSLPFIVYKKEFDKCLNIAVQAISPKRSSEKAVLKYCK